MTATPDQLKARWKTKDGRKRLSAVMKAIAAEQEWGTVLVGFDLVNGHQPRDLRGVELQGADLRGADLRGADLSKADLYECCLHGVNLDGADLSQADLRGTDLRLASLVNAKLCGTDLRRADLGMSDLSNADLSDADIVRADLTLPTLCKAKLCGANCIGANMGRANLFNADMTNALLTDACLMGATIIQADLNGATLTNADLSGAVLVNSNLTGANISGATVFGVSAWSVQTAGLRQNNLVITDREEPQITVDDIEVAQFMYLLLNNGKIRHVIDTITSKVVLLLGRFTPERKVVLDAIREELRHRGYCPVLFDFDKPASRDVTETITTLAGMARFVVADITDAKSIPQELQAIVPHLPSVAVQPLILAGQQEYGMFEHFKRYPWVLPVHVYTDQSDLIANIGSAVIAPAEAKVAELRPAAR